MVRIVMMDQDASRRHLVQEVRVEEGYSVVEAHNDYEGLPHDLAALPAGRCTSQAVHEEAPRRCPLRARRDGMADMLLRIGVGISVVLLVLFAYVP